MNAVYKELYVVDEKRLDRMENKLDKVVDALERLVRLEEKHDAVISRVDKQEGRLDRHADKIYTLEQFRTSSMLVSGRVERFVWLVVAALVGVVAKYS